MLLSFSRSGIITTFQKPPGTSESCRAGTGLRFGDLVSNQEVISALTFLEGQASGLEPFAKIPHLVG